MWLEYEIRKILEFSYTHQFSEVHTSFDEGIPKGEIRHYTGRLPAEARQNSCLPQDHQSYYRLNNTFR